MKRIFLAMLALLAAAGCSNVENEAIEAAIARQVEMYPATTLQYVYKSFYQECFGPGHIIEDEYIASSYFHQETSLSTEEPYGGYLYEPTGAHGEYYRVSLYPVNAGMIPAELLLSAFLRSAGPVTSEGIKTWKKTWRKVEKIAKEFDLPGYEYDKEALDATVKSDSPDKAVHHSEAYHNAYDPHYRIVAKDIFIYEILPLFN